MKSKQAADRKKLWRERMGNIPEEIQEKIKNKRVIWVHAVSVGEVMAVKNLLQMLLEKLPDLHLVLTTVTPTGQKIAEEMAGPRISVLYFPFDLSFACAKFFRALKPQALFLVETEIWPNLLLEAKKHKVGVGILNARLSQKSWNRYSWLEVLFRPLFESLDFVWAQTPADRARFVSLGVSPEKVHGVGNLKFDNISSDFGSETREGRKQMGWNSEDLILIAGSTHAPEEEILVGVFSRLKIKFHNLKLILAPRHIERSHDLRRKIEKLGLRVKLFSELGWNQEDYEVLLLDTLGVLKRLYQSADLVFVGGSLVRRGGQNPIEPAAFCRAIVHGPHVFNFEWVYRMLDENQAAVKISFKEELDRVLSALLSDPAERRRMGEAAYQVVQDARGATEDTLVRLLFYLARGSKERTEHHVQVDTKLFSEVGGRV